MDVEHEVDVNGWYCNLTSNSCASAFWWLNMHSCLFRSPIDICAVIIHGCLIRYAFKTSWSNNELHWGLSCFAAVIIPIRIKLREGDAFFPFFNYVQCNDGKVCRMVHKFSALQNWVSTFHSFTGGSSTASLTLKDWVSHVAWFLIWR